MTSLKWDSNGTWVSSSVGEYVIHDFYKSSYLYFGGHRVKGDKGKRSNRGLIVGRYSSRELARKAAQTDYDKRCQKEV